MAASVPVEAIVRDPRWLAHRYQPSGDLVGFLEVPRDRRASVPFLTDSNLEGCGAPVGQRRTAAVAAAPPAAALAFLFHSAFCCSTLLANALDTAGSASVLKEPVILNDLAGWGQQGAPPAALSAVLADILRLLARPFEPGESMVLKPSNVIGGLVPRMLEAAPSAPALLLHAPLETFLASVAAKGLEGRLWVRELAWKLGRDGLLDFGFDTEGRFRHTDLQVAALAWLGQQRQFARLVEGDTTGRLRTLDSERLLANPKPALVALHAHFRLSLAPETITAIARGPAFSRHAKSGKAFDRQARAAVHDAARAAHADEIDKVARWARAVAAHARVPMTLAAPLLS